MSDIEKWINGNYDMVVENATKITRDRDVATEILNMCLLSLLEYPADKQQRLYDEGKLEMYMTTCVNRQYKSSTSPYHRQLRRHSHLGTEFLEWKHDKGEMDEMDEYDVMCDCALKELNDLHFYYRILVQDKFINGLTYSEMNEKYKISKNSLLKDVKEGLEMLKQKCKK